MKKLLFILSIFLTVSASAQLSTSKTWNFRTTDVQGRKPITADFPLKSVVCHSPKDSILWLKTDSIYAAYQFFPYTTARPKVHKVTVTSEARYAAPFYANSVKTINQRGYVPTRDKFPYGNSMIINWADSTAYQVIRGVVTKTWIIYPYIESTTTQIFYNGWEGGNVTGGTSNNWQYVERVALDRFAIISTGARVGSKCARVEVRSGDNPIAPTSPGTSRAEVYAPQGSNDLTIPINEATGTLQYKFSIKLDTSWTDFTSSDFAIFFQIKGNESVGATNPLISFSATDSIRMKLLSGDLDAAIRTTHSLSDGTLNKGNWIDFRITIKYAKAAIGYILVERRNEGRENYSTALMLTKIPTLMYRTTLGGSVGTHYIKTGLYRNDQSFTSILYLDDFTISEIK